MANLKKKKIRKYKNSRLKYEVDGRMIKSQMRIRF